VELPEQVGLRLSTNVVGAAPEDVFIAQHCRSHSVHRHDAYYPVFIPAYVSGGWGGPVSDKFEHDAVISGAAPLCVGRPIVPLGVGI